MLIEKAIPFGGGTTLNFTVVAAETQPENPSKNTIWVDSAIPMNDYQIAFNKPTVRFDGTSLQLGDVFLCMAENSAAKFSALEKMNVELSVSTAYVWDGSEWQSATYEWWNGSEWSSGIVYLYMDGTEWESLIVSKSTYFSSISKQDECIYFSGGNQSSVSYAYVTFSELIDVTGFSTLSVDFSNIAASYKGSAGLGSAEIWLNVTPTDGVLSTTKKTVASATTSGMSYVVADGTATADVTEISGTATISITIFEYYLASYTGEINRIYLT